MNITELKEKAFSYIEANQGQLIDLGVKLRSMPELGYREIKTSRYLQEQLKKRIPDLVIQDQIVTTGFRAALKGRTSTCTIGIVGELDAVYTPEHPEADLNTGNAHTCGHEEQLAALVGTGWTLQNCGIMEVLDGDVILLGIPAEEDIYPADFIEQMHQSGINGAGKQEFLKRGYLNDIDLFLASHSRGDGDQTRPSMVTTANAFRQFYITIHGKRGHSAFCTRYSHNALNCAIIAKTALEMMRDSFPKDPAVVLNIHLNMPDDNISDIPETAMLRIVIRAREYADVEDLTEKMWRAIQGSCKIFGCTYDSQLEFDLPPLKTVPSLNKLVAANADFALGNACTEFEPHGNWSNDLSVLSQLAPIAQTQIPGFKGWQHSADWRVVDPYLAYVLPVKIYVSSIIDLLTDGANRAKAIQKEFQQSRQK